MGLLADSDKRLGFPNQGSFPIVQPTMCRHFLVLWCCPVGLELKELAQENADKLGPVIAVMKCPVSLSLKASISIRETVSG